MPDSFVYFCQPVDGGPIKIGLARDPKARLMDLQIGSPVRLRMVAIIPGGRADEQAFHTQFAAWRLHGEWFDAAAEGLADVVEEANAALREYAAIRIPQIESARKAAAEERARRLQRRIADYRLEWRR